MTSLAPPALRGLTREHLLRYFEDAWRLNELLFSALEEGAIFEQPDPLRHPLIFYFGHTAAFYLNKMRMAGLIERGLNERYEELFAKGVDPAAAAELEAVDLWPSVQSVTEYRARARDLIRDSIQSIDLEEHVLPDSPHWSLLMGVEHARIHFETSSVLFRQLDVRRLHRPAGWRYAPVDTPPPQRRWLRVPERSVVLGRSGERGLYGWDNEYGRLEVEVPSFEATAHLVSNAEFYAFWRDAGYTRPELWTDEGWRWREKLGVEAPRFWVKGPSGEPRYRAMFDELDMPWSWPVEVNAHEAQAYCRWAGGGARLMTEAEWTALRWDAPLHEGDAIEHPGYNLNLRYGSPCAVDQLTEGVTPLGFHDAYGNVWQWFSDDFRPLPGFKPHPLYLDFSEPYFDEQHAAMGGGAWASTGTSASRWYRLWFRRHFYQHAGFRLARDVGSATP